MLIIWDVEADIGLPSKNRECEAAFTAGDNERLKAFHRRGEGFGRLLCTGNAAVMNLAEGAAEHAAQRYPDHCFIREFRS